jgi:ApbE superfamily uncharacterized protein (UPF0280 family)
MYQPRLYREYMRSEDLISFKVSIAETDLFISAEKNLTREAEASAKDLRACLETYIVNHPDFKKALVPTEIDATAPTIVKEMAHAAMIAGVGPMASVAGAFAEAVGKQLLQFSPQVIVENGGDIFISSKKKRIIGIYAGKSMLNEKLAMEINPQDTPCGICTSSGTVGHSLSFGKADAVTVLSESASLADAAATAICNRVHKPDDIAMALEYGKAIPGVAGVIIIIGDNLGAFGKVKLMDM